VGACLPNAPLDPTSRTPTTDGFSAVWSAWSPTSRTGWDRVRVLVAMGAWRCLSSCADEHIRLSAEQKVVMRGREGYLVGGGAYWRSGGAPDMVPVCCAGREWV
jgi:hypothetical protein